MKDDRPISLNAALNVLHSYFDGMLETDTVCPSDLYHLLETMPSAQPEIIRCKDCKFYSPMNRETKTGICNLTMHQNFGDDWFCAGAERRTDETD